ncbi:ovostatin homolog precursor [Mus musculus]|uniref:Alpha-2-macroglobulin-like protein 1 n=3 Tax=Mus musculus TaxID=10090 RepID=OVOS_MOUSE|nr:ovostatin homolog precursor [Mus musculus]Q3UU35.2 RecName: Full=Ovostatin homolog; Flags: Precursor [Mus musculus]|eukprot:NP_001001179.2 ovostatin homolog precursor [Mus musculus]
MVPTILLSALLLHFTDVVAAEPRYILWVSSVVQRFSSEKACLHLLNLNESVSLSVTLEYDGSSTTIFDQPVDEGNFYACADFKVSQMSSEQLAFVALLVQGNTLKISERRSVAIAAEENATFVQTDTPVHKPGDTVHFRVVTLNIWLKPVDDLYPLITVQDPQSNVIFQWINVTTFRNITQLSFQLTPEPILGDYTIVIKTQSGTTVMDHFTVNRDVLPKFEVELTAPETITIADSQFQMVTCAKYTYGQPVQGKAQIKVCRELFSPAHCESNENEICEQFTVQLKDGCASHIINTKVFQLDRSGLFMTLNVNEVVTESGTGVQMSKTHSVFITSVLGTVSFENMDPFYRRGITYFGTLKFSGPNNTPLVDKLLQLELDGKPVGNYTTDENGEARFSINTSEIFGAQISLKAVYVRPRSCHRSSWLSPEYLDAYFSASRFYSQTSSFTKIILEPKQLPCDQEKMFSVLYSLNPEAYKEASDVTFFYLVMVRGGISRSGQKQVRVQAWNGNFSFPISINADLAPSADLFVYTLHPSGEIVADNVRLQIEKCFKNKVSINFSRDKDLPGSNTSVHLQAAPDSFCALRAVDKSALLLNHGQEMTPESVYFTLPYIHQYGYFYNGLNLDDQQAEPCIPQKDLFYNGLYYTPTGNIWDGDLSNLLSNMGLKIFTNLHYRKPEVCSSQENQPLLRTFDHPNERIMMYGGGAPPSSAFHDSVDSISHAKVAIKETVRTNFPRTWIWNLVSVDSSGTANVSFLVPDTITQWEASAFCVNGNAGFGISPKVSLQISQPFFVEVTSPFSVVRSEQSDMVVTVFNYLTTCVEISVQLEASENYEASINTQRNTDSEVLQAGEQKTYVWTIIPKTLGKVNVTVVATSKQSRACPNDASKEQDVHWKDTVVKTMLVEAEGIEKEATQSFLICPKGTKASKQTLLELPSNVVEGSVRSFVTIVGDILGVAMQNLESLLQMPYGCGEQNIAQLASDVYILDYLKATDQLTEELKSKAQRLLSNGYQNHLSFKNYDGSYDVFCQSNQEGSTWLSALSFKTVEKMKEYIFIEETVPKQTLIWLVKKQKSNGCFRRDEKHVDTAQEGREGDQEDIALTAYVVGVFLEVGLNASFPALRNGLYCLEEAFSNGVTNGYTQAILAYVFALAGKEQQAKSLLSILDKSATKTNNMIYWERDEKPETDNSPSFIPSALSGETEKTCYVLLAVLSQDTQDLDYASKIVQWLAQRMNSHGGFSAMQDTTVCLLALTQYMKLTGSNPQNTITLSSEESEEVFYVNRNKRLLVQHSKVSKGHQQYTVDVEGDGCSFIQATLRYNVPLPKEASGFSLSVKTGKSNSSDEFQTKFELTVTLTYTGARESSVTVLVDVKMLSGFTPVVSSTEELKFNSQVTKTDIKNGHVLFYLENVPKEATSLTFSIEQTNHVANIQPAPVTVYSYEKGEYAFDSYNINSISDSQ